MRSLRSSKCLKTTVELTFSTQKANACSPWTACSVFNWKYLCWVNLVQKLKIICLSWNFVPRIIQICTIPCWCSLFCLRLEIPFLVNLVQKIKIVRLSWNFAPNQFEYAELCIKYVVFTFSVLDQKNPFCANLVKKSKLSVKAEIWYQETDLNMRNPMTMLNFSVFDRKYLFLQVWSKK